MYNTYVKNRVEDGVRCDRYRKGCNSTWGFYAMSEQAKSWLGKPCPSCTAGVMSRYKENVEYAIQVPICGTCGTERDNVEDRHSLGIYAGSYCDPCWSKAPYRKEGPEGFDPAYAGECYEDDY